MIEKYLQTIKSPTEKIREGRYTLKDPHHGEIDLQWQGKYLWGIIDLNEASLRLKYLKLFEERLQKK
jgi:hypothetical protein